MNLIEQINSHKYLLLDKLVEVNDLELVLFVNEARADEETEEDLKEILEFAPSTKFNPIVSDEKCKKYKLVFNNYLAFCVRNESFAIGHEDEKFEGRLFRRYAKSKFLDYLQHAADMDYATHLMDVKEYFHFGIGCLNHIIDVSSAQEPAIEEI